MLFKSEKTIVLFLVITLVLITVNRLKSKSSDALMVFSETNGIIEESMYIIDLSNEYITTKNLDAFSNIESILPSIEDKYSDIINISWYNFDKTISNDKNISNLEKKYIELFKYNALNEVAINIEYNGLRIDKIKISTTDITPYNKYNYQKLNLE